MCLRRFGVKENYKWVGIALLVAILLLGLWGLRACVPFLEAVNVSSKVMQSLISNNTALLSKYIPCEECRQRVWDSWQKSGISNDESLEWRFRRVIFVLELGTGNQDSTSTKYEVEYAIFTKNLSYLAVFEVLNERNRVHIVNLKIYKN